MPAAPAQPAAPTQQQPAQQQHPYGYDESAEDSFFIDDAIPQQVQQQLAEGEPRSRQPKQQRQHSSPPREAAPPAQGAPAPGAGATPPPSAQPQQTPAPPAIPGEMLELAESLGVSRQEAQSFGDTKSLARALGIMSRQRAQLAQPDLATHDRPAGTREQPQRQQQQQQAADELEWPDEAEMVRLGYDDHVLRIARTMRAMHDRYSKQLDALQGVIPHVQEMARDQQLARVRSLVDADVREAGYDPSILNDAAVYRRAMQRIDALHNSFLQAGETPPARSVLWKSVIPLVAAAAASPTPPAVGQPSPDQQQRQQPPRVSAQRAAIAQQMDRDTLGRFTGLPSHRQTTPNGQKPSQLYQTMVDKGLEPGEFVPPDSDDDDGFLPG